MHSSIGDGVIPAGIVGDCGELEWAVDIIGRQAATITTNDPERPAVPAVHGEMTASAVVLPEELVYSSLRRERWRLQGIRILQLHTRIRWNHGRTPEWSRQADFDIGNSATVHG